jgi:hypothetical protein
LLALTIPITHESTHRHVAASTFAAAAPGLFGPPQRALRGQAGSDLRVTTTGQHSGIMRHVCRPAALALLDADASIANLR